MKKNWSGGSRQSGTPQGRLRFVAVVLPLLLLLPAARAFQLQVLEKEVLRERASSQARSLVKVPPRRGPILDSSGQPLAVSVPVPSIYAIREDVRNPAGTAQLLSSILGEERRSIQKRLEGTGFVWLKRMVSPEQAEKVRQLGLEGVGTQEESRRYYPNLDMAAAVLGFVGTDKGLEGIECSLEEQLRGDRGVKVVNRDALGNTFPSEESRNPEPAVGSTVQLTVDRTIQYFVERELQEGCRAAGAEGGAAIVMEVATGRILAMASYPSFNPNEFGKYGQEEFRNRAVSMIFEPGSTFKVVTVAAALEEGVFDEMDIFFCGNGRFTLADRVIRDPVPHGWLTMQGIIKKSSNIGASKVGLEVGSERLGRYATAFGLGERTGILLPGEGRGLVRRSAEWRQVDTANIAFGQGIGVTPIQMINAVNALATGGLLMEPYIVERITSPSGEVVLHRRPKVVRRAVSEETARKVARMMESVVTPDGSGSRAVVPGFTVAGKTGTAQKYIVEEGGYSKDRYVASFAGFAPSPNAVVTAIVVMDEPREDTFGGVVAAPVWSSIMQKTLKYLKQKPEVEEVPDESDPPAPKLKVASSEPAGGVGEGAMPDLRGLTLREALERLSPLGRPVVLAGSGVVVSQVPEPGSEVKEEVRLRLEPRFGT